jgi:hypothetical protein
MKRDKAVKKLARKKLKKLSQEQRGEQLQIMLLESWDKDQGLEVSTKRHKARIFV